MDVLAQLVRCLVFLENQQRGCALGLDHFRSSYLAFVQLLSMAYLADHNFHTDRSCFVDAGRERAVVGSCYGACPVGWCMAGPAEFGFAVVGASSSATYYPWVAVVSSEAGTGGLECQLGMGFVRKGAWDRHDTAVAACSQHWQLEAVGWGLGIAR